MSVSPRRAGRFALTDIATGVVLVLAIVVISVPGGALYSPVHTWLARRRVAALVSRDWPSLSELATPLYAGAGPPDVIEFTDYQCPFCRAAQAGVDSAVQSGVRVAVIQFPLTIHPRARLAALTALCGAALGSFPAVHGFLMSQDTWMVGAGPVIVPTPRMRTDSAKVATCEGAAKTQRVLSRHVAMAKALGIAATPTFVYVRGVVLVPPTLVNLQQLARHR